MQSVTQVYLALGTNIEPRIEHLQQAIAHLSHHITHMEISPVFETPAMYVTDQADFYNCAVRGGTLLRPRDLLERCKDIEQQVGRQKRFRYGPREVDIDIIFYGDTILDDTSEPSLHIPHALFDEREFVLAPLSEIASNTVDPRSGKTVAELYQVLGSSSQVTKTGVKLNLPNRGDQL